MVSFEWQDQPDESTRAGIVELLVAARASDGRPDMAGDGSLPDEFRGGRYLVATDRGGVVGCAHLDTSGDAYGRRVVEMAVHPDHRGRGIGAELTQRVVDAAGADRGGDTLRAWSHGDHPGARALAERFGFDRARELWVMRCTATDSTGAPRWSETALPAGLTLRTFVPGDDDQALVDLNARAFSWHPEQAAFSPADLRDEQRADWFDPAGFFLAEHSDGTLAGFHWTKIHPANPYRFGGEPVGEVYVLGVDPRSQGAGVGKALTVAGLRYLVARGLGQIILYVEGDNAAAIAVYRRLGFELDETDVQYSY